MKTTFVLLLVLAAAALSAPGAEAASFKSCGSVQIDSVGKAGVRAKVVSCKAARKVIRDAGITLCFDNQIPGWTKEWRPLANGGKALTLKKGAKAIKTNACSPK